MAIFIKQIKICSKFCLFLVFLVQKRVLKNATSLIKKRQFVDSANDNNFFNIIVNN